MKIRSTAFGEWMVSNLLISAPVKLLTREGNGANARKKGSVLTYTK
jgi:hypothetical protein